MKNLFLFLTICICLVSVSKANVVNPEEKVVEVEKAPKQDICQYVRLIGTIKAKQQTSLVAKKEGQLEYLAITGQPLKKGELIAKLESKDLTHHYTLSKEAERLAKSQYERVASLYKTNAISKQMVEEKRSNWIDSQKALSLAKTDFEKTQFIAPFDGVVGASKFSVGSQVQSGDHILTFYDPNHVKVEFDIPAVYFNLIKNGQSVVINGQPLQLKNIQKMIDPQTQMLQAEVDYKEENYLIGNTIDVDLALSESKQTIVLANSCIFLKNGKSFVYVVKEGKAELKPVGLGIREKDKIEVTWGVEEGDLVISQNQNRLYPQIPVRIHQTESL